LDEAANTAGVGQAVGQEANAYEFSAVDGMVIRIGVLSRKLTSYSGLRREA
jgi:hypothetical protein